MELGRNPGFPGGVPEVELMRNPDFPRVVPGQGYSPEGGTGPGCTLPGVPCPTVHHRTLPWVHLVLHLLNVPGMTHGTVTDAKPR